MSEEHRSNGHKAWAKEFRSFAVLDLETSNLPQCNGNQVGITELSIYGFAVSELLKEKDQLESNGSDHYLVPETPRVLHKLTLMLNPCMTIDSIAGKMTNLDNNMLENESEFDDNAASILLAFLKHLQSPICLVAHNGWNFDFPILKAAFVKINKHLPADIYCVDSLRAFYEIDELRPINSTPSTSNNMKNEEPCEKKQRLLATDTSATPKHSVDVSTSIIAKPQRFLYSNNTSVKRFPPKGVYKLNSIFERIFQQPPAVAHHAEADVKTLTKLMLHYGQDFLDYANQRARSFAEVNAVGFKSKF